MLAKDLKSNDSIDSLIAQLQFEGGICIHNLEELLTALEEYGARNRCRVPWVIDGLNESQDPSSWHDIIARIIEVIQGRHEHVLLVVTLRTGQCSSERDAWRHGGLYISEDQLFAYKKICIPDCMECVRGVAPSCDEMVKKYFKYFKIAYDGHEIPWTLLHPLMLRLYCESVNKSRMNWVRAESLPYDLSEVFDGYCSQIAINIAGNKAIRSRKRESEYRKCIRSIGKILWDGGKRYASITLLSKEFPDNNGGWESEWENILSQEGLILSRPDWEDKDKTVFEVVYDGLAGYLVADFLSESALDNDIKVVAQKLLSRKHELSDDILSFLTWLYPRRNYGSMLYKCFEGPTRAVVLRKTIYGDARYMSEETKNDLIDLAQSNDDFASQCFSMVFSRAINTKHPINVLFLDRLLNKYDCGVRDRVWGRWLYTFRDQIYKRLMSILSNVASIEDFAAQKFFMFLKWMCVSNVLSIRDRATQIMILLGERFPCVILGQIISSIGCNDPYVIERLAAAGYGILMSLFSSRRDDLISKNGLDYSQALIANVLEVGSKFPTADIIALDYMINSIALVNYVSSRQVSFAFPYIIYHSPFRKVRDVDLNGCTQVADAIHMDFENYTLTRLVGDMPYRTDSVKYKHVRSQIEQRMYDLGFRMKDFEWEDRLISEDRYRPEFARDKLQVERFGKKYSLIAYREMAAILRKRLYPYNRFDEVDIDPSFPSVPKEFPIQFNNDIFIKVKNVEDWLKHGKIPCYKSLLECQFPEYGSDKWVMMFGVANRTSSDDLMNCWTMIKGFVVQSSMMDFLMKTPKKLNELAPVERDYIYVGESPWSLHVQYNEEKPCKRLLKPRPNREKFLVHRDEIWDYFGWYDCPYECFRSAAYKSYDISYGQGYLLSYYFMLRLGLRVDSKTWEMKDENGRVGAMYFRDGDCLKSERSFLYIRKDLLLKYLRMEGGEFGWVVSGEKGIKYTEWDKHKDLRSKLKVGDLEFERVVPYLP